MSTVGGVAETPKRKNLTTTLTSEKRAAVVELSKAATMILVYNQSLLRLSVRRAAAKFFVGKKTCFSPSFKNHKTDIKTLIAKIRITAELTPIFVQNIDTAIKKTMGPGTDGT